MAMRPPLPEGARPLAAGAVAHAVMRQAAGMPVNRDHMWEVLHARDKSTSPRPMPGEQVARARAYSEAAAAGRPPYGREGGGSPTPAPPNYEGHRAGGAGQWTPRNLPRRLPEVGWEVPNAAFPDPPDLNMERYDLKAGGLLKNDLRHKILGMEAASADAQGWMERRLESVQAEQRADLGRRWSSHEQADRRFKEWVQREHEEMTGQLQQVKASSMDGHQQQHRQASAVASEVQKLTMRLQEVEAMVTQADAKANGIAHAVQANGAGAGRDGSNAAGALQGELGALRMDLEREASARSSASAEATDKIKELHGLISAVNERQEHEAYSRQQQLADQSSRGQARVAALEPNFEALRSELDAVRQQLQKTGGDCARRCEEVESSCLQRVAGVREAALSAARELWEEHNGVLAECKASMSSLQQILETKDKIAAQLQNLTQQQLQDDKEGLLQRLLQGDDALRGRLSELEAALVAEQGARVEAQHAAGAHAGRLGSALEQAQAAWVKESDRFNSEIREMRRQADRAVDGSTREGERRLAEAVDALHRRLDDLEGKTTGKVGLGAVEDRIKEMARTQEAALADVRARLKQQVDDLQGMQGGKLAQCDFDLRSAFRAAVAENADRARMELTRVEEGAAIERGLLSTSLEELRRESEARIANIREDFEQRFSKAEDTSARRATQSTEASSQLKRELTDYHTEARAHADRVGQDAKANAAVDLAAFMEEVARKEAKNERTVSDIAREIASVEGRLTDAITIVDAKASKSFKDALKLEREHLQNEVETLLEEERTRRMQGEAERLASLQKRLAAHEGLTTRCLDNLKTRQDDAFAAHRQSIEALLVQDGKEISSKIEELVRTQRAAEASTKAEVQRLDGAHEQLTLDTEQANRDLAASTEEGRSKLEDRMQRELAAYSAKITTCMTTCSTEMRHGMRSADERLTNGLAGLSERLSSGLASTAADAEASNKTLQEALEASIAGVTSDLAAHALESEKRSAGIRSDQVLASAQMDEKLKHLTEATQAFDADLDRRVKGLESGVADLSTALEKQGTDFTASLAKASDETSQGLREVREAAEAEQKATVDRFQQASEQMQSQEASIANGKQRLDELEAQMATSRTEADAARSDAEAATRALDDKLMGEIGSEQEQRLQLTQRLQELEDAVKEGTERSRAAETELNLRFEESKGVMETQKHEHDLALGAELTRATAAEEKLEEKLEAMVKEQVEQIRNEQGERIAEVTKRLETQNEELQTKLQEQDQQQQKQVEDSKAELQTKLDATAAQAEANSKAVEGQQKGAETAKKDADTGVSELKDEIEKLKAAQNKMVEDEAARATAAEQKLQAQDEALVEKLQAQETSAAEAQDTLQSQLKELEDKQLQREGKLQEHYIQLVEASQAESAKEIDNKCGKADEALEERFRSMTEQQKNDSTKIRERLEKVEGLAEYRYAEQKGINDESYKQDKELSDRIDAMAKKEDEAATKAAEASAKGAEASAKAAASAEESEALAKLRGDVQGLQQTSQEFHISQAKTNEEQAKRNEANDQANKARDDVAALLGEQVESCKDAMGKVDSMAKKEEVRQLKARVEGGFNALIVQIEAQRWLKANIDSVSDGVSQAFMQLVDQTSERVSKRVSKVESALADPGAA